MMTATTTNTPLSRIEINIDCGEDYGHWRCGQQDEELLMPLIDVANIACGGHAGDPVIMRRTVALAKKYGIKVGAHPGFPDKVGFGRRLLGMTAEQAYAEILYQVGALKVFLDEAGLPLNHIKPHGMWYILMQTDETFNDATMRAIKRFNVPLYGLPNTLHESGAKKHGIEFVPEAFVDLNYSPAGHLLGVSDSRKVGSEEMYEVVKKLAKTGGLPSVDKETWVDLGVKGKPFSVCIHSDFEGCLRNLEATRRAVDEMNAEMFTVRGSEGR